jgi:hypothetical protein
MSNSEWEMTNPFDLAWKAMTLVGMAAIFTARLRAGENPLKRELYR